jgi:hypothetical protein
MSRFNQSNATRVELAPFKYNNDLPGSYEPQFIRVRSNNTNQLFCDIQDLEGGGEKVDVLITSDKGDTTRPGALISRAERVAVESVGFFNNLWNVNPYNNEIKISLSYDDGFSTIVEDVTVNVQNGLYTDIDKLLTAVEDALNAGIATTADPVQYGAFSFVPIVDYVDPTKRLLQLSGNSNDAAYYFLTDSLMLKFGSQLINLPDVQVPSASKYVGSIGMLYTRYVDFFSNSITHDSKSKNISNNKNGGSSLIYRHFLSNLADGILPGIQPRWSGSFPGQLNWMNFEHDRFISSIDIQLRDQFGNSLYNWSNPDRVDTSDGFLYDINFIVEL